MANKIQDRDVRRRALDPHESFLVQAPAGSGKTELLIQRYLTLLARAGLPEEIVAITFTRKAAAEMRDRVLAALTSAGGDPPEDENKRFTWDLARAARERNLQQNWDLEAHPARLRIQTIDALSAAIVRELPILSRLGSRMQVVEDAEELYLEAARQTLALLETGHEAAPAVATLLRHLDNQLSRAGKLLAQMLAKRDQWMYIQVEHHGSFRGGLERVLEQIVEERLHDVVRLVPDRLLSEIVQLSAYAASQLGASASALKACAGLTQNPSSNLDALPCWIGFAELLLKKDGELRAQPMNKAGFTAGNRFWQTRMKNVLAAAQLSPPLSTAFLNLRRAPARTYTDAQFVVIEALWSVLPVAVDKLQSLFETRAQADFIAFGEAAYKGLRSQEQPTALGFAIDNRIRHLLVDEFQDTSQTQYRLFDELIQNWSGDDGRTLFLVGDPMQSIFGFREADVSLFLQARDSGISAVRPVSLQLVSNFRSQPELVEWSNLAFAQIFPDTEDALTGSVTFSDSVPAVLSGSGSPPEIHPLVDASPEQETATVVDLVRRTLSETDGSVAVLLRARTHCPGLASALRNAGIPFEAVEFDSLTDRGVIQDLLAVTRALVQPADRISWFALLRAPWCGLLLADLTALASADSSALIPDLIANDAWVETLSADGRQRILAIRHILLNAVDQRRRRPLSQAVRSVWTALGGPDCTPALSDREDAEAFFQALADLEAAGDLADLTRLDRRIEKLFARPEAPGARVHLLTMHKAKGLEFDTVILAGLGQTGRQDEPELLSWQHHPKGIIFAPLGAAGDDEQPTLKFIQRIERERSDQELRRLLYVAVTRARRRLHLVGIAERQSSGSPAARSGSMLRLLWPMVGSDYVSAALQPPADPAVTGPSVRVLRRVIPGWQEERQQKRSFHRYGSERTFDSISFSWTSETLRHIGTVVHRELRLLGRPGAATPSQRSSAWEAALLNLGVPSAELAYAVGRVRHALESTLADERGRWILAAHEGVESELELTGWCEGVLRRGVIDRTFVENGVRWLIDFKTSSHEGGELEVFLEEERRRYAAQFATYATLLSARSESTIRCGLYFPLMSAWMEWPSSEDATVLTPAI